MVKKSITVTDQQDSWIKFQITSGHYGNESEVVRELIRERQLQEQQTIKEIEIIRTELRNAESSGFGEFNSAELLKQIKNGLGCNGL